MIVFISLFLWPNFFPAQAYNHAFKIFIVTLLVTTIKSMIKMKIIIEIVMMMILMMIIWLVMVMVAGGMERKILLMIVALPTPMTTSSYGHIISLFWYVLNESLV